MSPRAALLAGGVCLIAGGLARAAAPAIASVESSVRLGLIAGYGTYGENNQPQHTESGALIGAEVRASSLSAGPSGWPDIYASLTYDFMAGLLRSQGSIVNSNISNSLTRADGFYNIAIVRLGVGQSVNNWAEVIPYAAGGYQNWYRDAPASSGYGKFYQAALLGGGLKLDLVASPMLVVSAAAEGFAMIGGSDPAPSQSFSGGFGSSAEERVSLDADYRLNDAWHAFAGLGVTHDLYSGTKPDTSGGYEPFGTALQMNSLFGLAYGF